VRKEYKDYIDQDRYILSIRYLIYFSMFLIISIYINRAYFIVYQPFQTSNPLRRKR